MYPCRFLVAAAHLRLRGGCATGLLGLWQFPTGRRVFASASLAGPLRNFLRGRGSDGGVLLFSTSDDSCRLVEVLFLVVFVADRLCVCAVVFSRLAEPVVEWGHPAPGGAASACSHLRHAVVIT